MQDFRHLEAWRRAHRLVLRICELTASFPISERYGLTAQLRRSAVSIASNIAEGRGRGSDADFSRFISIALGSASELDYQLLLATDLGYLTSFDGKAVTDELNQISKMMCGLQARLRGEGRN